MLEFVEDDRRDRQNDLKEIRKLITLIDKQPPKLNPNNYIKVNSLFKKYPQYINTVSTGGNKKSQYTKRNNRFIKSKTLKNYNKKIGGANEVGQEVEPINIIKEITKTDPLIFTLTIGMFEDFKNIIKAISEINSENKDEENKKNISDLLTNISKIDTTPKPQSDNTKFIGYVYGYILLSAYIVAYNESIKDIGAFNINNWWFFSKNDLNIIMSELNLVTILTQLLSHLSGEVEPVRGVQPDTESNDYQGPEYGTYASG
jgi:hypothetical protein